MNTLDDHGPADVDDALPARRERVVREPPELIALVLLAGSTIGAVVSIAAAVVYVFVGDHIASGDGTGSYSRADLGQSLLLAGRFADGAVVAVLIAVAALWWHLGVLRDRLDDLDDDLDDESDAAVDAGDAEFLDVHATLARESKALRWARALVVACAVGAVAGVAGQFLQFWQAGFGSTTAFVALATSVTGIAVVTLALALAGWIAVSSLVTGVRSDLDLGTADE